MKAAVYGTVAGILFGLSAALTKPTLDFHAGIDELLSHWEPHALAIAGVLGFVLQQISLGTEAGALRRDRLGRQPVVGILLGTFSSTSGSAGPPGTSWSPASASGSRWRAPS